MMPKQITPLPEILRPKILNDIIGQEKLLSQNCSITRNGGSLMKLVKIFAGLVILILILAFLTQNTNIVTVDLIFVEPKNVKVANVMLGAISVGILIGFGVALTNIISNKSEIRSLKTKNRKLSDELNDLRNVAIEEGIYDTEDGEN